MLRSSIFFLTVVSLLSLAIGDVGHWTVSTSLPSSVLQVTTHPEPIGPFLDVNTGALPTNQFWTNFIQGDGSTPVVPLPYVISMTNAGLAVGYPSLTSEIESITATHTPDWIIGTMEELDIHQVTSFTELSVQLEQRALEADGLLSFPIVRGSPYITAKCSGLTPLLYSAAPVRSINGQAAGVEVTESRFLFVLEDDSQWVLYLSQPTTLLLGDARSAQFQTPFNGVLRLAFVPSAEVLVMLDQHAGVYPTSASVSYSIGNFSIASIVFTFATEAFPGSTNSSSSELFMLALPHHYDVLLRPTTDTSPVSFGVFRSLKGGMREVFGSEWELHETLPDYGWYLQRDPEAGYIPALKDSLRADTARLSANSTDPYWLGKELASIARLALIADVLQEDAIAKRCRDFVREKLERSLNSLAADALLYETDWGGIVTRNSLYSPLSDGGLCWYNSHLSRYGSLLFAAAVVSKADPAWASEETRAVLELLVRDLVNPSQTDSAFPVTRQKDWYEGHSWSLGLQHTQQGKALDSIAEAAHAYYAVHLWGVANSNKQLADFASLLTATELRAARRYWQMTTARTVYDPEFSANRFVDEYASLAVTASQEGLFTALARQLSPLSPLLPFTLYRTVVQDAYIMLHDSLLRNGDLSSALRAFAWVSLAQIEPDRAFFNLAALPAFGYAETRTNMLYFAATRMPFDNSSLPAPHSLSPVYSRNFLLSVDFAPDQSSAATSAFSVDSGATYSDAKGYGWLKGSKPTGSTASLSQAWGSHFATFERFDSASSWKAAVPAAGDYFVRVVTVAATASDECGALVVRVGASGGDTVGTIEACPGADEAVRVWSGVVSLPYAEFVLTSKSSTNVAFLEISSAVGSYLEISFRNEPVKKRDSIGILTPPDSSHLRSAVAAVTAQPEERFHVHWVSVSRASVLVLDSRNYPGAEPSSTVAQTAQRAPLPMWANEGVAVTSVLVTSAPGQPPDEPAGPHRRYHVPLAVIVITALLGSAFIIGSLIAIVVLLRKKAARPYQQEFGVLPSGSVSSLTGNQSPHGSQVDLLQRSASAHTISPTHSANALSTSIPSPPTVALSAPNR